MIESETTTGQSLKIVLIEDNPSDADLVLRELKKSGHPFISEITDTEKGFESLLDNFKPDIILSDYSLPGFDALSAFQIKENRNYDAPFIIVSGTIGEENAVEMIKMGITDYVLKDKLFTLYSKIIRAINEAKGLREKRIAEVHLKEQHNKLLEIAFLQSHQVRVPVTQFMGLFNLFDFKNLKNPDNIDLMRKLNVVAKSLDSVIHQITEKTNTVEGLNSSIYNEVYRK